MEVRNAQIFNTSINGNLDESGDPTPIFSKVIGRELYNDSIPDIYSCYWAKFKINAAVTKAPDFVHLGLPDVNAADELVPSSTPATRVGRPTDGSNWSAQGHLFW